METNTNPFTGFPKIPRFSRDFTICEKIDGTNASIKIEQDGTFLTGSRTRWITPEDDNFGFSRWAHDHKNELVNGLGPGHHFGEWYGAGIQRNYGLKERRFALFNTSLWTQETKPHCCHVVPVLCRDSFDYINRAVEEAVWTLKNGGSQAVPGFMNPEGIVIYHVAGGHYYKRTLANDDKHKGEQ